MLTALRSTILMQRLTMPYVLALLALLLAGTAVPAWAQHDSEHGHAAEADTTHQGHEMDHMGHGQMQHGQMQGMDMSSAILPGLPMTRDGSGTGWHPDASPMHALHAQAGPWGLMLHGSAFLRYNAQDVFERGSRGDAAFGAPNWIMGMAQRPVSSSSQLAVRAMLSLDPLTVGGAGYPLLFQTGETWQGEPLIDRQHPHDFFSELSVTYGQQLGEQAGVFAYAGYPGEPALGPPAFMHRPSGWHNPNAPLGHHWQDATHIVFGVATLGARYGPAKIDASVFTGQEPGEERWGFDEPRFDSYSARLSVNPTDRWALQVSRGYLRSPEALEPELDLWRTTASALYHVPLGEERFWATALVWGWNDPVEDGSEGESHGQEAEHGHHASQHSLLLESDLRIGGQALYGRAEWVQQTPGALGLSGEPFHDGLFDVGALTLGTARDLLSLGGLTLEVGAQGTLYAVPGGLEPVYGTQPASVQVYLHLTPSLTGH